MANFANQVYAHRHDDHECVAARRAEDIRRRAGGAVAATDRRASSFETSFVRNKTANSCERSCSTALRRRLDRSRTRATSRRCEASPFHGLSDVTERQARLRARATSDIDETIAYLRGDAGDAVALAFIDALRARDEPHHTFTEFGVAAIRLRTRHSRAAGVGHEAIPIRDLLRAAGRGHRHLACVAHPSRCSIHIRPRGLSTGTERDFAHTISPLVVATCALVELESG